MEDVYTIKIKTKPDTRNLYPSERRYSASTVSGLAWVHIALGATALLLACLALINPSVDDQLTLNNKTQFNENTNNDANKALFNGKFQKENVTSAGYFEKGILENLHNDTNYEQNVDEINGNSSSANGTTNFNGNKSDSGYILVLAPALLAIFASAAGVACIFASVKWYIDHNITWLFIMSCLSTIVSLTSFIMVAVWFVATSEGDITEFYKDKVPFKDYVIIKHSDIIHKNDSHLLVSLNPPADKVEPHNIFTNRVLSINILIAAFLELLWSLLSLKISYKGMKNTYKEDVERRGNCISVVTKIKGNDRRKMPRNGNIMTPKTDLINNYPSKKIKRIFLAQSDNGFYMKNQQNKSKQNTETSSEIYKERMMNFLNRCASLEGISNPEISPSVHSESLNPIPEITTSDLTVPEQKSEEKDRMTPVSWGDNADHTVYNQNTLNLDKIFMLKQTNSSNKSENALAQ